MIFNPVDIKISLYISEISDLKMISCSFGVDYIEFVDSDVVVGETCIEVGSIL